MKKLLFPILLSLFSIQANCFVVEVPLAKRVAGSSLIVEGKVINKYSFWNTSHTMIYSSYEIELYKIFKGKLSATSIEIITEGGTVGLSRITVEPSLELEIGDWGIFTCEPIIRAKNLPVASKGKPRFEVYASVQGFVKYNLNATQASDIFRTYSNIQQEVYNVCAAPGKKQFKVINPLDFQNINRETEQLFITPVISSFSPGTVTAGTVTILTINGSNFGATQGSSFVNFKKSNDGGASYISPLPTEYISWSNTQIRVEVPANAGTGTIQVDNGLIGTSAGSLIISYAHLNVQYDPGSGVEAYGTDHINDNAAGGYTWRMNTGFAADVSANASFMNAFSSWRCNTGVNWVIGATTGVNDALSDATNVICFDNTAPLSPGILGTCFTYWSGCSSGPTIVWYVNELDIIFDEGSNITPLTWEYGPALPSFNEYDFETVAVHELGHGHQLGHVINNGAIMHYSISNGSSNRSLGVNDLAGGNYVQAKSVIANICGPGAMQNYSCAVVPVANFSATPTTVCTNVSVAFTDLSTNTPTSWAWTFTGGTPNSSSSQNPSISYAAAGSYNVTLTATNSAGSDLFTINSYITVLARPSVGNTISPISGAVCAGQSVTLTGSGAQSYAWTGGVTNAVSFTPVSSNTYTVTGTAVNGCTGTSVASITVNALPSLVIVSNPINGIVCSGLQGTLTASGANSYSWTGGITNAIPFTPLSSTTYTVTGTGVNGCQATATRLITVQVCNYNTQLSPTLCNSININYSQTITATSVLYATNYEFLFANPTLSYSQSRVKGNGIPTMPLTWIIGLQYGQTYNVRVRAYVGGVWQAYGPICTIAMASTIPATQLVNCSATNLTLSNYLTIFAVPGASDFEYEVTNASQPYSLLRLRGSPTITIGLSWFANLQYGRTYNCRVRSKVGGVWGSFGPSCTFAMQASNPATQLTPVSCGVTGLSGSSTLYYAAVVGATNYEIKIQNTALSYSLTRLRGNSGTNINLTNFTGLLPNTQYDVLVRSYIGGQWGVFGSVCSITMGNTLRLANSEDVVLQVDSNWTANLYPNPVGNVDNPSILITGAKNELAMLSILDITGRIVQTFECKISESNYSQLLEDFPNLVSGVYFLQVQIGDRKQTTKFIASN